MKIKPKIVVLSGAGISVESGLATFRGADGLWEGHNITEVASPQGWYNNKALVLEFYNQRRRQVQAAQPNRGHYILAELEQVYEVVIITQNVDDLHERAGSSQVIHLHGELSKARSTLDETLIYDLEDWQLKEGDLCEKGSQLRPHIVWFGEAVPLMARAIELTQRADIFIVVGTSLAVYPAAGLLDLVAVEVPKFVIDPNLPVLNHRPNLYCIAEKATTGLAKVAAKLV